jgi:hypothetical protein
MNVTITPSVQVTKVTLIPTVGNIPVVLGLL